MRWCNDNQSGDSKLRANTHQDPKLTVALESRMTTKHSSATTDLRDLRIYYVKGLLEAEVSASISQAEPYPNWVAGAPLPPLYSSSCTDSRAVNEAQNLLGRSKPTSATSSVDSLDRSASYGQLDYDCEGESAQVWSQTVPEAPNVPPQPPTRSSPKQPGLGTVLEGPNVPPRPLRPPPKTAWVSWQSRYWLEEVREPSADGWRRWRKLLQILFQLNTHQDAGKGRIYIFKPQRLIKVVARGGGGGGGGGGYLSYFGDLRILQLLPPPASARTGKRRERCEIDFGCHRPDARITI
ncbi:hypothetical protein B0H13DRAFT_1865912 [Mycena leptocephala]|nr:hypothetical protein B0H13DRAFT_1865912 [Mycena leptocephala]